MKITSKTLLEDLHRANIIDINNYRYLHEKKIIYVNDVFTMSVDNDSWSSLEHEVKELSSFLYSITTFFEEYDAGYIGTSMRFFPQSLLSSLKSIYQKEKNRFDAGIVLRYVLHDDSNIFFQHLFYSLLTDAKSLFDEDLFMRRATQGKHILNNVKLEFKRFKIALTSIIVNFVESLAFSPDCIYYKKAIESSIEESAIDLSIYRNARAYLDMLSFKPSKAKFVTSVDSLSVYVFDENIQTAYKKLQNKLSNRTKNILLYNLPRYVDIMPWVTGEKTEFYFRGCGSKSKIELVNFLLLFKKYLSENTNLFISENDVPDFVETLTFLIRLGVDNIIISNMTVYQNLVEIYPLWRNLALDITDATKVYTKIYEYNPHYALDCFDIIAKIVAKVVLLITTLPDFEPFASIFSTTEQSLKKLTDENTTIPDYKPFSSIFSTTGQSLKKLIDENKIELEYQKYITEDKDKLLTKAFKDAFDNASVQARNAVQNNHLSYRDFMRFIGHENRFMNLRNVGLRGANELSNMLLTFSDTYQRILMEGDDFVKSGNIKALFYWLNNDEVEFVKAFKQYYDYFPMFFVINAFFKSSTNVKAQIYASFYDISDKGSSSIDDLAAKYSLSRERVRQIVYNKEFKRDKKFSLILDSKYWNNYSLHCHTFISSDDSQYIDICKKEIPNLTFFNYCGLLGIFTNLSILNLSYTGKILSSVDVEQYLSEGIRFHSYGYDPNYNLYRMPLALREASRLIKLQRDETIKIHIKSYFIENIDYWNKKGTGINKELQAGLMLFFEELITKIFPGCVENDFLLLHANKKNYSEILYGILKENGDKMHLSDIFRRFKELYPDDKYNEPNQIKPFMVRDERIENIGRSSIWKLSEWAGYTGSLPELAVELVSKKSKPVTIADLAKEMLSLRPDSTERSATSIIHLCIKDGKLVDYYGDLVGLPNRNYGSTYVLQPHTFDEWMEAFKKYVFQNNCFPTTRGIGYESSLYNWYYYSKNFINLSSDEILKFHQMLTDLALYPHTHNELKFFNNCNRYREFAVQAGRMLTHSDEPGLFAWFEGNKERFLTYEDNRKIYFKNLLSFLTDKLGYF